MTLKELYKEIYCKQSGYFWNWYPNFKSFVERIRNRIEEIKEGVTFDIENNSDDKAILQELLVEVKNGVMEVNPYRGLKLTQDKWADYIMNNKPFIDCLQDYMKNPDNESYFNRLQANCNDYRPNSIINRIAATCTQKVSTAYKVEDFDQIVNYLENEKIIPKDSVPKEGTWFAKNIELMKIINEQLDGLIVDGEPLDDCKKVVFVWLIKVHCIDKKQDDTYEEQNALESDIEEYIALLKANHNLILTGAPGTGKTYLAKQIAMQMIFKENTPNNEKEFAKEQKEQFEEQFAFVQFHPSYDYTDFVDGLRPINDESNNDENSNKIGFKLKKGIFKAFCERAKKSEFIQSNGTDNFDESWDKFIEKVEEKDYNGESYTDVRTITGKEMKLEFITKDKVKLCLKKSHSLDKKHFYNVYKGLPGWPSKSLDSYIKAVIQHLKEKFGLKDYSEGTISNNDPSNGKKYIFVIDEINRGEISKIFGELFFSIDPGYRGIKGKVKTQYQNLIEEGDSFYDGFYVPENVYIIGTMNDIDRSVESFDFAMRRRFTWVEIKAEENLGMLDKLNDDLKTQAENKLRALNNVISKIDGLGSAYHIGGAYFLKLENYTKQYSGKEFDKLWEYHLEPLLKEYLRGNEKQILDNHIEKLKKAYDGTENTSQQGEVK